MQNLIIRSGFILILLMIQGFTSFAFAAAVDDVERAAGVHIDNFSFSINGNYYEAGNLLLPKPARTLDTTIDARALGLPVALVIPLHGSRSGDTISWSFDVSPSPGVDIGFPNTVTRIRGVLVARATFLPGGADPRCSGAPCPYNVQLTSLPGSSVTATITSAGIFPSDHAVENIRFIAQGGLPRPALTQFYLNLPSDRICSRDTDRYVSGHAATVSLAPSGGAWISITSSAPEHVRVMGVTIPEGEQSAPIGLYISPHWSGGVTLTASAGGVTVSRALTIDPPSACSPPTTGWGIVNLLTSCRFCFIPYWMNSPGDLFGDLDGRLVFVPRDLKLAKPLSNLFPAGIGQVIPMKLNNENRLVGVIKQQGQITGFQGQTIGFVADVSSTTKPHKLLTFNDAEVVAMSDLGLVVGTRSLSTHPSAFYSNGMQQVDVPVKAEWSRAVATNNRGDILGNMGVGKLTRPFVYSNRIVEEINVGSAGGTATALSEAGDVVGFMLINGEIHGFMAERQQEIWRTKDLGTLPGFSEIRPNAVNSAGVAIGTARGGKVGGDQSTGFLYSPETGLVDLNKLAPTQEVRITDAVAINDANQILVYGILNGKKISFILQPTAVPRKDRWHET
jgi:hypothetical protein